MGAAVAIRVKRMYARGLVVDRRLKPLAAGRHKYSAGMDARCSGTNRGSSKGRGKPHKLTCCF